MTYFSMFPPKLSFILVLHCSDWNSAIPNSEFGLCRLILMTFLDKLPRNGLASCFLPNFHRYYIWHSSGCKIKIPSFTIISSDVHNSYLYDILLLLFSLSHTLSKLSTSFFPS